MCCEAVPCVWPFGQSSGRSNWLCTCEPSLTPFSFLSPPSPLNVLVVERRDHVLLLLLRRVIKRLVRSYPVGHMEPVADDLTPSVCVLILTARNFNLRSPSPALSLPANCLQDLLIVFLQQRVHLLVGPQPVPSCAQSPSCTLSKQQAFAIQGSSTTERRPRSLSPHPTASRKRTSSLSL